MNKYFAYVRVSTVKQGEKGVSLQEQRDAIERYAKKGGLEITEWFEERETAAKRGRPVFNRMLRLLRGRKADGVVIHKIDRSARNLKDWADLGELIDQGITVHFANEALDLQTRGGRLSADIQAVVAADFIRNLKEETRKGMCGRLKQGIYPFPAPLGYLDEGKAKPKGVDTVKGPLVRQIFELYGAGRYGLHALVAEMERRGLRNKRGGKLTRNGLSTILNNPFYIGLIRVRKTGQTYPGLHQPLISKALFDRVQENLRGKTPAREVRHEFLFRRLLRCGGCGYSLVGERQKGHVYYRCQTPSCPETCVREEAVDQGVRSMLTPLRFSEYEKRELATRVERLRSGWTEERRAQISALELRLHRINDRLTKLADAFLDGALEKTIVEDRQRSLLMERANVEEKLGDIKQDSRPLPDRLAEFLELAGTASNLYETAQPDERRDLLRIVTSNRSVESKTPILSLSPPFDVVAQRAQNAYGAPYRARPRTLETLVRKLWAWFRDHPAGLSLEPLQSTKIGRSA